MGLFEDELKQISQMHRDLQSGKMAVDKVNAHIGLFSQTEKRIKLMIAVNINSAKFSKSILNRAIKSNLLGDGQAIDIEPIEREVEKVKCPLKMCLIERQKCLDLSGSEENMKTCLKCDNCKTTKDLLLP